jgi:hypothetical protein
MTITTRISVFSRSTRVAGALAAVAGLTFVGGGVYSLWYTYNFVPPR